MTQTTVLCVEDEPELLNNLASFLETENFRVVTASDGEEGLQKFRTDKPDLVLCDIGMPKMTGLQMFEVLSKQDHDMAGVPFIFLTAYDQLETQKRARQLGCDDFLVKPVDFNLLLASMKSRLQQQMRHKKYYSLGSGHERHALTEVIGNHLLRPLHNLMAYADTMVECGTCHQAEYLGCLQDMAEHHLDDVQALAELVSVLLSHTTEVVQPSASLSATLCRAFAAEYGVSDSMSGSMCQLKEILAQPQLSHIKVDESLALPSMRRLLHGLRTDMHNALPQLVAQQDEAHFSLTMIRHAISATSLSWTQVKSVQELTRMNSFKGQHGLTLLHAVVVFMRHQAQVALGCDKQNRWQAISLNFPLSAIV